MSESYAPWGHWEGWLKIGDKCPVIYFLKMGDKPISKILWLTVKDVTNNSCVFVDDQDQIWKPIRGWGIMWTLLGPDGTRYHMNYDLTFGKVIEGDTVKQAYHFYVINGINRL